MNTNSSNRNTIPLFHLADETANNTLSRFHHKPLNTASVINHHHVINDSNTNNSVNNKNFPSFSLNPGEIFEIFGPSNCGKN